VDRLPPNSFFCSFCEVLSLQLESISNPSFILVECCYALRIHEQYSFNLDIPHYGICRMRIILALFAKWEDIGCVSLIVLDNAVETPLICDSLAGFSL
jgi:hypothetical protein